MAVRTTLLAGLGRAKQKESRRVYFRSRFDETKAYVQKVMNNYRVYKQLYTPDLVRK